MGSSAGTSPSGWPTRVPGHRRLGEPQQVRRAVQDVRIGRPGPVPRQRPDLRHERRGAHQEPRPELSRSSTRVSEGATITAFQQATEQKTPLLGYFYDPQWLHSKIKLVRINLPSLDRGLRRRPEHGRVRLPAVQAQQDRRDEVRRQRRRCLHAHQELQLDQRRPEPRRGLHHQPGDERGRGRRQVGRRATRPRGPPGCPDRGVIPASESTNGVGDSRRRPRSVPLEERDLGARLPASRSSVPASSAARSRTSSSCAAGRTSSSSTRGRCSRPAARRPMRPGSSSRRTAPRRWPSSRATPSRSRCSLEARRAVVLQPGRQPGVRADRRSTARAAPTPGLRRVPGASTSRVIDPDETARLWPLVDRDAILGAYHVPTDGLAKAVRVSEAQARRATEGGARFLGDHTVTGIRTDDGRVRAVITDQGEIEADIVVCAAGIWGPLIGAMVGLTVPLQPLAHQYTKTTPLREMAAFAIPPDRENVHPIVRVQDRDLYFREHVDRLGVGSYAHRPRPDRCRHDPVARPRRRSCPRSSRSRPTPSRSRGAGPRRSCPRCAGEDVQIDRGHQRHLLVHHGRGAADGRVARRGGLLAGRGGVGDPRLRRRPGDGRVDRRRRAPPRTSTRPTSTASSRTSWRPRTSTTGASRTTSRSTTSSIRSSRWRSPGRCGSRRSTSASRSSGRTSWRATAGSGRTGTGSNEALLGRYDIPRRNAWAERYWHPIAGAEARATRDTAGLYDMTSLKRLEVTGPGALAFLDGLTTNRLDRPGRLGRVQLMLDERGGIRSDLTIARLGRRSLPDRGQRQPRLRVPASPGARPMAASRSATSPRGRAASGCGGRAPATSWRR